jgi:hypothetical protein
MAAAETAMLPWSIVLGATHEANCQDIDLNDLK